MKNGNASTDMAGPSPPDGWKRIAVRTRKLYTRV